MFIPDPDFYPSRIPDPATATKERGKKLVVLPFFVATNMKYHKIENNLFNRKRKNLNQFTKNYVTFYQKIATKLAKIWVWD
jgi:hypothetical protein